MAAAGEGGHSSQNPSALKLRKINWFINVLYPTHAYSLILQLVRPEAKTGETSPPANGQSVGRNLPGVSALRLRAQGGHSEALESLCLRRGGAVPLTSALSWLPILQQWQDVDSQHAHDAAEFFTYLIEQAGPVAFNGT